MRRVVVVTDSTACLPKEMAQELGVRIVPLNFVFSDTSYRDDPDLNMADFYEQLEKSSKTPITSPASPGTYLELFREAGQEVDGILCITVASRISGMYEGARVAREMAAQEMPDKEIRVMDSGTAAMAQGFVALAAARAAARGETIEKVCQAAEEVRDRVKLVAMVDTLRYLAKSGRFPRIASWGASLIGLKPILTLRQGQVRPVTAARSSRSGARKMLKIMGKEAQGKGPIHASVIHGNVPEEADEFAEQARREIDCAELFVSHFTPVMGIYTGPGVLGLAFYSEG